MTNNRNSQVASSSRPIRERVGLIIDGANAAVAVKSIIAAEDAGIGRYGWHSHCVILSNKLLQLYLLHCSLAILCTGISS